MRKALLVVSLISACLWSVSLASGQPLTLFEARVLGFNQGNRNLDIHVFTPDGSDAGYYHDVQCSIVYWADGDTTFPFELAYDPATQQVTWVVDTPDSGALSTTSPTTPPADPVNNLYLYVKATAGPGVSTCYATPYQYCQAGGWACNIPAQVDSSAVYLTGLELDGVPLPGLSVSAIPGDPTPVEAVEMRVNPAQPWTLTGNVRFSWVSANGYPPKEARIMFSAKGQYVPCTDDDEDGYSVEEEYCGAVDCNDSDPDVNPGVFEGPYESPKCTDRIDNNCNGHTDDLDPGCAGADWALAPEAADASAYGSASQAGSSISNLLTALMMPIGAVILLRRVFRKR